ncbi:hypothetical protein INR49_014928 [Caranx melampygus]|nr:hypothetical protein INR49_014928 [Caranx melampygus]
MKDPRANRVRSCDCLHAAPRSAALDPICACISSCVAPVPQAGSAMLFVMLLQDSSPLTSPLWKQ